MTKKMIMLKFGERKVSKEEFYGEEKRKKCSHLKISGNKEQL